MTDDLYARLRAANPVPGGTAVEPATSQGTRNSMEVAMSTSPTDTVDVDSAAGRQATPRSPFWFAAGIAAAAAGIAVAGSLLIPDLLGDDAATTPAALILSMTQEDATMSCAPVSADVIAAQDLAFAGTVTAIAAGRVELTVDQWFHGGKDATQVELTTGPDLVGYSIDFQEGTEYLISATDGAVSICGLSGELSPELNGLYLEAFPQPIEGSATSDFD